MLVTLSFLVLLDQILSTFPCCYVCATCLPDGLRQPRRQGGPETSHSALLPEPVQIKYVSEPLCKCRQAIVPYMVLMSAIT
eukprot:scaffold333810_cov43-Prasinocladus_malaysianus.AAC.1